MKKLIVLAVALIAAPAFAADSVPQNALQSLGLGGIQEMTAAQGDQVRGAATAVASSLTTISGTLFDPTNNSFVNFAGSNYSRVSDDAMAPQALVNTAGGLNPILLNAVGVQAAALTVSFEGYALGLGNTAVQLAPIVPSPNILP